MLRSLRCFAQFRVSAALQRVELVNIGADVKLFSMIGKALAANPCMPLAVLDLSQNAYGMHRADMTVRRSTCVISCSRRPIRMCALLRMTDKGLAGLAVGLEKLVVGLAQLNLARCGLTKAVRPSTPA